MSVSQASGLKGVLLLVSETWLPLRTRWVGAQMAFCFRWRSAAGLVSGCQRVGTKSSLVLACSLD